MFLARLRLLRIPISLALLCLLCLSILFIKNDISSAWQKDRQEDALYLKSPNCFPHRDPSEVDQSLPPCQNLTVTIIAKPQNTTIDHRRSGNYPRTHRFFTLQYTNGYTQTVGDIDSDMWNSVQIGSQASVTLWRGQVEDVNANGDSQSIFDEKKWNRTAGGLVPWIVLGLISSACLSLLWKLSNDSTRMML